MKELIIQGEHLKKLLELLKKKELRSYVRFGKEHKVRCTPVETAHALPTIKPPAVEKMTSLYQLVACIINSHAQSKDMFVVEADVGKDNLVVHYREGKEKEACDLIDKAFIACTPRWTLGLANGQFFIQCKGPRYLPALLAYSAKQSLQREVLPHYYHIETVASDIKPQEVICRIALTPEPHSVPKIEVLIEAAAILRDTHARVDYAAGFYKNMRMHCNLLLKREEDDEILEALQEAATFFLSTCTLCENIQTPESGIKIIAEYIRNLLVKYPDLLENSEKYYDFKATYEICNMFSTAVRINQFASRPPLLTVKVDLTLIEDVRRPIVSMTLKLMQNAENMKAALESTATEIQTLVEFYKDPTKTEAAKESLCGKINEKTVEPYSKVLNNFLDKRMTPVFIKDDAFEAALTLHLEFTQQLEAFALIQQLRENARSCQLSVFGVLLKYYRDSENWALLEKTAQEYCLAIRDISSDLFNEIDKAIIPLAMSTDIALARDDLNTAFEYHKAFVECFFDLTKPSKTRACRKLFDVANLSKKLLLACAEKKNVLDVLNFSIQILNNIQALLDTKKFDVGDVKATYDEIDALGELCAKLERIHIESLNEAVDKIGEQPLPFLFEDLCFTPKTPTDLRYFSQAFRQHSIKYRLIDDSITLRQPTTLQPTSLRKALLTTVRLKEKDQKYKVVIEVKLADECREEFIPMGKIGFQRKPGRSKKNKAFAMIQEDGVLDITINRVWRVVDSKNGYACISVKGSSMAVFDFSTVKEGLNEDLTVAVKENQFSMGRAVGQFGVFKQCGDNYELKLGKMRVDFQEQKATVKIESGEGENKITKDVPVHHAVRIRKK